MRKISEKEWSSWCTLSATVPTDYFPREMKQTESRKTHRVPVLVKDSIVQRKPSLWSKLFG